MPLKLRLLLAMALWGSLGLFIREIPLPSELIALVRSVLGAATLGVLLVCLRIPARWSAVRADILPLALSALCLGANWILLFEAYRHATIPVATLCYYMAPVLIVLLSPLVLGERLTPFKIGCVVTALSGIALVSGILDAGVEGSDMSGVLCGLGAACGYTGVVLCTKRLSGLDSLVSTFVQLAAAALLMLPYVLLTVDVASVRLTVGQGCMLAFVGVVLTGTTFALFFNAVSGLPAQTTAAYCYIDPIVAIALATVVLHEPLGATGYVGGAMILGATYLADRKA